MVLNNPNQPSVFLVQLVIYEQHYFSEKVTCR
jgi:hypothetical protein